jgi:hypothetical protein
MHVTRYIVSSLIFLFYKGDAGHTTVLVSEFLVLSYCSVFSSFLYSIEDRCD